MSLEFKASGDYYQRVADRSGVTQDWPALRVLTLTETSNDVSFANISRNTINIDLSGTRQHLTVMDGIRDDTPTRPGDVCLLPMDLSARFAWETVGPLQSSLTLEFDNSLFATYCPEWVTSRLETGVLIPKTFTQNSAITSLALLLARELDPTHRRGRVFAEQVIRLLAMELAHTSWSSKPADIRAAAPDARISKAIEYIAAHSAQDISLLDISNAAHVSPTHLTALFRRHTGQTPYSYVIDQRVKRATHLLTTTQMPISHVALEAGFSDQQHLTRIFRSRMRTTPGAMRKTS